MTKRFTDDEFVSAWKQSGGVPAQVSRNLNLPLRNVYARRRSIEQKLGILLDSANPGKVSRPKAHVTKIGFRITEDVTGPIVVFSDMHSWPGDRSTAFDAMIKLIPKLNPAMVVCGGDSFDGARISRHPPGGWADLPEVADELAAVQELHGEIEHIAPEKCKLIWSVGNHDSRFTSRLAQMAPEYVGVHGTDITDHFPAWNFCWSLWLNGHTVVKHRWNAGVHGAYNNVLKSGKNIVTGHTHRLHATMFADYNGLRFGVETGTMSDFGPENDRYAYAEDSPSNWSQGFVVLTFAKDGMLLEPEFCRVIKGKAYFRGQVVS